MEQNGHGEQTANIFCSAPVSFVGMGSEVSVSCEPTLKKEHYQMAPAKRLYFAIRSLIERVFPQRTVSENSHFDPSEYEREANESAKVFQPKGSDEVNPSTSTAAQSPIRPLRGLVILYVDHSRESRAAKELLQSSGISPFVTDGPVEPLDRKPMVIFHGGFYRGK